MPRDSPSVRLGVHRHRTSSVAEETSGGKAFRAGGPAAPHAGHERRRKQIDFGPARQKRAAARSEKHGYVGETPGGLLPLRERRLDKAQPDSAGILALGQLQYARGAE